tara:strand:- start:6660 stop:6824 length:165 start_codon:yes stop_codon:yes gene_type:complete
MKKVTDVNYTIFKMNQLGKGWFRFKPSFKRIGKNMWMLFWLNYRITRTVTEREI